MKISGQDSLTIATIYEPVSDRSEGMVYRPVGQTDVRQCVKTANVDTSGIRPAGWALERRGEVLMAPAGVVQTFHNGQYVLALQAAPVAIVCFRGSEKFCVMMALATIIDSL